MHQMNYENWGTFTKPNSGSKEHYTVLLGLPPMKNLTKQELLKPSLTVRWNGLFLDRKYTTYGWRQQIYLKNLT